MSAGLFSLLACALAALHGWAVWLGLDGSAGLSNGWPLWRDDHPLYFYYARITPAFLWASWSTAGYDPTFMAGYAKSIHFPASSTLVELLFAFVDPARHVLLYKLYVLLSAAAIPWLVYASARLWRIGACGTAWAVGLFLVYVWTDFPINYASFGMLPYLLAVPLGLVAAGAFLRYCESGGAGWWALTAALMSGVVLIHFTAALTVAPAAAAVYLAAWVGSRGKNGGPKFGTSRHVGVWAIPALVVALNAFWWWPGVVLRSTKGPSGFAFAHPEGVVVRLRQIATTEAPVERVLVLAGLCGFVAVWRLGRPAFIGLLAFAAAGFGWGYLAGGFRALDFLQPGRHTYAFFTGLCLAAGCGLEQGVARIGGRAGRGFGVAAAVGLVAWASWLCGADLVRSVRGRVLTRVPFLSSLPSQRLLWVVDRVIRHVRPGERLLYEEGGFGLPGVPDPFQGGRFSGLLPWKCPGVEVIGGPYLHAALTTNFTQFGEGKLFGRADWDRDWFERYARLYRPAAVVCWSPRARAFCRANPDLVEVKDDDGAVLIGRVHGFGGAAVAGRAEVVAAPGRLTVTHAEGGVDGFVVLRYHSVPCLRADPPATWEPVFLENDPVPFIKLRPPPGPVTFRLRIPRGPAH